MATLTIHIPDQKTRLVKQLLKELDIAIKPVTIKKNNSDRRLHNLPNAKTVKAINEAKKGKTKRITNFKAFFDSI